jgi:hypothetical protein
MALEHVAERAGGDAHAGVAVGVDDVGGRGEDDVDPVRAADLHVGVEGARVAREVFLGPNCSGLRKIVTMTWSAVGGPADEAGVPVVQGAHRHDDGDVTARQASRAAAAPRGCGRRRGRRWPAGHSRLLVLSARVSRRGSADAGRNRRCRAHAGRGAPSGHVGPPDLGREPVELGRWSSTVPTSPRATGPVRAASPRRRALSRRRHERPRTRRGSTPALARICIASLDRVTRWLRRAPGPAW